MVESLAVEAMVATPLQVEQILERCPEPLPQLPTLASLLATTVPLPGRCFHPGS